MNKYDQRIKELGGNPTQGFGQVHVPETALDDLESELGHPLPPDYREFVRDYGCYTFNVLTYPFKHPIPGMEDGTITIFYGVLMWMAKAGQTNYFLLGNDVLEDYKNKISSEVLPPELLPIGYDPCSNHVCIAFAGEQVGSVYFWDASEMSAPFIPYWV